jgi:hypothetical protein
VTSRGIVPQLLLATWCLSSCRFQDLTPGNARHDEATVPGVVAAFYQAIGARDLAGLERAVLPASTALLAADRGPVVLIPMRNLIEIPERRNQSGGARIVHTELHTDGDVATDRVVVAARSGDGKREYEASDVLTLAHRAAAWQVAHAMLGPWRIRSAP